LVGRSYLSTSKSVTSSAKKQQMPIGLIGLKTFWWALMHDMQKFDMWQQKITSIHVTFRILCERWYFYTVPKQMHTIKLQCAGEFCGKPQYCRNAL